MKATQEEKLEIESIKKILNEAGDTEGRGEGYLGALVHVLRGVKETLYTRGPCLTRDVVTVLTAELPGRVAEWEAEEARTAIFDKVLNDVFGDFSTDQIASFVKEFLEKGKAVLAA